MSKGEPDPETAVPVECTIDGADFTTIDEFYDEVGKVLVPEFAWGKNLDAFNDILYGDFGGPDPPYKLIWKNSERSRVALGHAETARYLKGNLQHVSPASKAWVSDKLKQAERGLGQTLFDELVEIIRGHDDIILVLA
jgi:RNAse (barnase) inhibitor barstar